MEKYRVTKLNTALEQLEWAIKLLLEDQAYIPAITLAAAAEEVLGKAAGVMPVFAQMRDELSLASGLSTKWLPMSI